MEINRTSDFVVIVELNRTSDFVEGTSLWKCKKKKIIFYKLALSCRQTS